jgi:hypothetical protein
MSTIHNHILKKNLNSQTSQNFIMPMLAGTLQTDPRSGGIKRSSGVNVLPIVATGKVENLKNK